MSEVTEILQRIESGDAHASDDLLPIVYQQLRRLASKQLEREMPGQTLQTTALVHEAYLRLVGGGQIWDGKGHFISAAAEAMRRILVDRARSKRRIKHGGELNRIELDAAVAASGPSADEVVLVNDLLDTFAEKYPVEADVVKLHYFAGFNVSEAGRALGISSSAAHRHWVFARAWFREEIGQEETKDSVESDG